MVKTHLIKTLLSILGLVMISATGYSAWQINKDITKTVPETNNSVGSNVIGGKGDATEKSISDKKMTSAFGRILYDTFDPSNSQLVFYSIDIGSKKRMKIAEIPGDITTVIEGRISPDDTMLAYTTCSTFKNLCKNKLELLNISKGSILTIITVDSREFLNDFLWSLDGKSLYYFKCITRPKIECELERVDVTTKNISPLNKLQSNHISGLPFFLGISQEKNRIYLSMEAGGFLLGFYSAKMDGTDLQEIFVLDPRTSMLPSLSPNGNNIAYLMYTKNTPFANTIRILDVDSGQNWDAVQLDIDLLPYAPLWSFDSNKIIFGEKDRFWIQSLNGKTRSEITERKSFLRPLAWTCDGSSLVFASQKNRGLPYIRKNAYPLDLLNLQTKSKETILDNPSHFITITCSARN
jgi:hypothetical protein